MNGPVTAPSGAQTLHVKSWGNQGAACDTDVALNIEGSGIPGRRRERQRTDTGLHSFLDLRTGCHFPFLLLAERQRHGIFAR